MDLVEIAQTNYRYIDRLALAQLGVHCIQNNTAIIGAVAKMIYLLPEELDELTAKYQAAQVAVALYDQVCNQGKLGFLWRLLDI